MKPWTAWSDEAIKRRQPDALAEYRTRLADKLEYHRVTQFLFDEQWHALKKYANDHFIQIIGDMPILCGSRQRRNVGNTTLLQNR